MKMDPQKVVPDLWELRERLSFHAELRDSPLKPPLKNNQTN